MIKQESIGLEDLIAVPSIDDLLPEYMANLNIRKKRDGFIYWMFSERSKLHKIGFSVEPLKREKTLKTAVPDIKLQEFRQGLPENEKQIHQLLVDWSAGGEWFETDPTNIIAAMDLILPKTPP